MIVVAGIVNNETVLNLGSIQISDCRKCFDNIEVGTLLQNEGTLELANCPTGLIGSVGTTINNLSNLNILDCSTAVRCSSCEFTNFSPAVVDLKRGQRSFQLVDTADINFLAHTHLQVDTFSNNPFNILTNSQFSLQGTMEVRN